MTRYTVVSHPSGRVAILTTHDDGYGWYGVLRPLSSEEK